ncbi:MAG: hypothetical protein Q9172_002658 [Xanthocarpia lactea]
MVDNDIDWSVDPYGRRAQYFNQFRVLESEATLLISKLHSHRKEIETSETEYQEQIAASQKNAYFALQGIVDSLLKIKNGETRLSRENALLVTALTESTQSFSLFCDQVREHMRVTGSKAGHSMSEGDGADVLIRSLRAHYRALDSERKAVTKLSNSYRDECYNLKAREATLQSHVNDARSNQARGNSFLALFDSGLEDRLEEGVQEAERVLIVNLYQQRRKNEDYEALYKLASAARLAGAATISLMARITKISNEFDTTFDDVTESQEKAAELWKGLLGLRAKIENTDYKSTRDNSLRIVLQLLTADDRLFSRSSFAADVEQYIKRTVEGTLGVEALSKLLKPEITTSLEDFGL